MNKPAVLISIRPEWCEPIVPGRKTVEVRKTKPKVETPIKSYIYCTKDPNNKFWYSNALMVPYRYIDDHSHNMGDSLLNGLVIGEFVCDQIDMLAPINHCEFDVESCSCLSREQIVKYLKGRGYGWHISDLKIYDKPKELSEFTRLGGCQLTRPPQSWCYVEELEER